MAMTLSADEKARFLTGLRTDPDFLEEVRREVLTRELLSLPEAFTRLVGLVGIIEADLRQLIVRVDDLTKRVDELTKRVDELTKRVDDLTKRMDELTKRMDELTKRVDKGFRKLDPIRGFSYEWKWRDDACSYLGTCGFRKVRFIAKADLADLLDEALNAGRCDELTRNQLLRLDAVHSAVRTSDQVRVYVAAEVSAQVDDNDIERARDRARALEQTTGVPVVGVVVGAVLGVHARHNAESAGLIAIEPDEWAAAEAA